MMRLHHHNCTERLNLPVSVSTVLRENRSCGRGNITLDAWCCADKSPKVLLRLNSEHRLINCDSRDIFQVTLMQTITIANSQLSRKEEVCLPEYIVWFRIQPYLYVYLLFNIPHATEQRGNSSPLMLLLGIDIQRFCTERFFCYYLSISWETASWSVHALMM